VGHTLLRSLRPWYDRLVTKNHNSATGLIMKLDNLGLKDIITGMPLSVLEESESVIYVLDKSYTFMFCNPAWDEFYWKNGGKGPHACEAVLGTSLFDVIPSVLEKFYADLYERANKTGLPVEHEYECSAPDEYRLLRLRVLPVERGFIVSNDSIDTHVRPVPGRVNNPDESLYRDKNGLIVMCSHCRRARRREKLNEWEYVPFFVMKPPADISHGLCDLCLEYYYPEKQ